MSRSYKKTPYCGGKDNFAKKLANKRVRQYKEKISNGTCYKKLMCSYDICDYGYIETFETATRKQEIDNLSFYRGYLSCNYYENTKSSHFYMNWYRYFKMK